MTIIQILSFRAEREIYLRFENRGRFNQKTDAWPARAGVFGGKPLEEQEL
jgi:hypothetical protein